MAKREDGAGTDAVESGAAAATSDERVDYATPAAPSDTPEASEPSSLEQQPPHSRVIVGGWQLSAGHHDDEFDPDQAIATLGAYADRGLDTVDVGDIYTGVEELVGRYVLGRRADRGDDAPPPRIHTKLVPDLDLLGKLEPGYAEAVVLRSINRLEVPALDLMQFHWWDWGIGNHIAAYRALAGCVEKGLVRRVGLTNYDTEHMLELIDAGLPVASNQVQYSVVDGRVETALTEACATRGVTLLCYGVLCGGFLSDRWLGQSDPSTDALENRSLIKYKLIIDEFGGWDLFQELLEALRDVADAHADDVPSDANGGGAVEGSSASNTVGIAAVAVAWVLHQPCVAGVILGARSDCHLSSTLAAADLVLTPDDLARIEAVRSRRTGPRGAVYALERERAGKHGQIMRYSLNRVHTDDFHLPELERRTGAAMARGDDTRIRMLRREAMGFPRTVANAGRLDAVLARLEASSAKG